MPFDKYKIRIPDGYKCELCGFETHSFLALTASSAMTNHIKSKHPKEYEEYMGHPPIWRHKNWEHTLTHEGWKWVRVNES